jgi:hypothetical protein
MNIIFDTENIEAIKGNNVVLELDTFYFSQLDKTATAYCVIDNIKLTDFEEIEQNQRLHAELIEAYKKKDFKICQDLIDTLTGSFSGEVDSFYQELQHRLQNLDTYNRENWNPTIIR